MTLEAKVTILWILAVGLALVSQIWPPSNKATDASHTQRSSRLLLVSLSTIFLTLIAVGLVSGTFRIHLVQISPLVFIIGLLSRSPTWGSAAAAAVLSFWLVTMTGIWLFLLGVSRFLTGTFSPTERLLTLVIGVACLTGLSANGRAGNIPLTSRVLAIMVGAGVQSLALWLSYQQIVIGR